MEHVPDEWTSDDGYSDTDPTAMVGDGDQSALEPTSTAMETTDRTADDVEEARLWQRRQKEARRARLIAEVERILRISRTPLRDIIRDHALPNLPAQSLLRFRSVSTEWNCLISAPIFFHTQSHTHRSASGVFHQSLPGVPSYAPFDSLAGGVPDPSLGFLPSIPCVALLASSNGLLACGGIIHSYYVCNPSTAEWTPLPEPPPIRHLAPAIDDVRTAVALVFEPSVLNLDADYHLIRGYEIDPDYEGVYGFQIFSSESREWTVSMDVCAAERLISGSGVSAGGVAYWRSSMQTVVAYDPTADRCRTIPWPMGYDASACWQLGEMDGRLCCACVTETAVEVHALGPSDRWSLVASLKIVGEECAGEEESGNEWRREGRGLVFRSRPWPLRFQSGNLEVMLWVEGRVVGLDVVSGRVREVCVAEGSTPCPYATYVPHISTFARVFSTGTSGA